MEGVTIISLEEVLLWWMGIFAGLLVFCTTMYWITEDYDNDDEDSELYDFVERHFGSTFLKIFKLFI